MHLSIIITADLEGVLFPASNNTNRTKSINEFTKDAQAALRMPWDLERLQKNRVNLGEMEDWGKWVNSEY